MARPKKETGAEEKETGAEEKKDGPKSILNSILNQHKEDHLNFREAVPLEKISSGSIKLDQQIKGGFESGGLIRFVGYTEGGKTSEALELMRNFLSQIKGSRGFLVKAEGRLGEDIKLRSGLTFVYEADEWEDGTIFVLETNVYEAAIDAIRRLVHENKDGKRYIFCLDSMDGLNPRDDFNKEITESGKVAGAPVLTKKFMTRVSSAMNKFGHICIMIGQVSAKIEIGQGPSDPRQITATGGNAALHFANWILQFEPRFQKDIILEDNEAKPDPQKNKILGHWCKGVIKKSPNETSGQPFRYPIRYGRTGGTSIWREYEIVELLLNYEMVEVKGAWFAVRESLINEAKSLGFDFQVQHQGKKKFMEYFEANPELTNWLFEKLRGMVAG